MKKIVGIIILILLNQQIAFAETVEPILITISDTMEDVNFDGKWTFFTEWKRSSLYTSSDQNIILRIAHQGDYIYALIDNLSDYTISSENDYATICIDGKNDKDVNFDENDYCFRTENNGGIVFQHNSENNKEIMTNLEKLEFIAIRGVSDIEDRYSQDVHSSYEFKIPIEFFGRESTYGFYFNVYDSENKELYQWPESIMKLENSHIPSPHLWGELISPDKSLPEFSLSMLFVMLLPSILAMYFMTRIKYFRDIF